MKRLFFVIFLVSSVLVTEAQEESNTNKYRNCFSFNFLGALISNDDIYRRQFSFETAINEKFSVLLSYESGQYNYGSRSIGQGFGSLTVVDEYVVNGNSLLLAGRFYPFRNGKVSPKGFFIGSYLKRYWLTEEYTSSFAIRSFEKDHTLSAFGFDIGYKFGKRWFMIEPVIGTGIISSNEIGEDPRVDRVFTNFEESTYSTRIEINVGVCF